MPGILAPADTMSSENSLKPSSQMEEGTEVKGGAGLIKISDSEEEEGTRVSSPSAESGECP